MPEPTSKFASDNVIYYLTNKISKHLCFISPNVISIVGFLFVIPILHNYINDRSFIELIILAFIKQFLDCLDGSVARNCDKMTSFGAKLDVFLDNLSIFVISAYAIYVFIVNRPKELYKNVLLIGGMTMFLITSCYEIYKISVEKIESKHKNELYLSIKNFFHDNMTLFSIVSYVIIKILLK